MITTRNPQPSMLRISNEAFGAMVLALIQAEQARIERNIA